MGAGFVRENELLVYRQRTQSLVGAEADAVGGLVGRSESGETPDCSRALTADGARTHPTLPRQSHVGLRITFLPHVLPGSD